MPFPILRRIGYLLGGYRIKAEGFENLPKDKNYIIAANHQSYLDPVLISLTLYKVARKKIRFLTKERIWRLFGQRLGIKYLGMIPIDTNNPAKSLEIAVSCLKQGEIIGIFPESGRNKEKIPILLKGKTGAAKLALLTRIPVVPCGVFSSPELSTGEAIRNFIFPKKKPMVVLGKPMFFEKYYDLEITKEVLEEITRQIMIKIGELCQKKYPF
jgi:1-acyl-sn-glycerol-3-phosphate acyltransferase